MSFPTNYSDADEMLTGRCAQRRKLANNTYLERRFGGGDRENCTAIAVRLHATDIVTFHPDGSTVLDSGGWRTVTTKQRMNEAGFNVWQERGVWYVGGGWRSDPCAGDAIPYADGMRWIPDQAKWEGIGEDPKAQLKQRRRVQKFARQFIDALEAGNVPAPGAGDCFYCCMTTTNGQGLGEATRDRSHIESHMDESYFVPSLLARAVKAIPVSQVAHQVLASYWDSSAPADAVASTRRCFGDIARDQLRKSLSRYLCEQLGTAR